ncbi:YraN family protein [Anaerovorax odorimutans]|uniref:YraN family protein n=1 Tax=Anaerovorax odorimutans TaxID=109327 RepID=UPI00041DEDF7|nr:YraN family protein [Anaerovorax odorimutans]
MLLGTWGEEVAAKYFIKKDYFILERNYSCKIGELDIIARTNNTIVFVEVKTRNNLNFGLPCESITENKKRHIIRVANYYIAKNELRYFDMRIDVVEILKIKDKVYLHHIKNAF